MKTIVAATDFSAASLNAVNYAAGLAITLKARLLLYHAVEATVLVPEMPTPNIEDYLFDDGFQKLEKLKDDMIETTAGKLEIDVKLKFGNMRTELTQLCYEEEPTLVVMAATIKEKMERLLLGSNTVSLSHKSETPILLVPENVTFKNISKIAIATDLSDVLETMPLDKLTALLKQFNTALDIVNVVTEQGFSAAALPESIALQTHFNAFNPHFVFVNNDNLETGITEYILQNKPDILIVVPKKHGMFYKSQSKQLVLHPSVPMMLLQQHACSNKNCKNFKKQCDH